MQACQIAIFIIGVDDVKPDNDHSSRGAISGRVSSRGSTDFHIIVPWVVVSQKLPRLDKWNALQQGSSGVKPPPNQRANCNISCGNVDGTEVAPEEKYAISM